MASDRAADPLDVAKENVKSYLQHAEEAMVAAPSFAGALRRDRNLGVCEEDRKTDDKCVPDSLPRLECRLGDGLAVLKEGEVDTVCIAGVGASPRKIGIWSCKYFLLLVLFLTATLCLGGDRVGEAIRPMERSYLNAPTSLQ